MVILTSTGTQMQIIREYQLTNKVKEVDLNEIMCGYTKVRIKDCCWEEFTLFIFKIYKKKQIINLRLSYYGLKSVF